MRPLSVNQNGKKRARQRSGTAGQGEEGAEEGEEEPEGEETDQEGEEREGGEEAAREKVKVNYEPLTHTHSRIHWVPVTLAEKEGGTSDPDTSSPEGMTGAERKMKKRPGAGAGGRHWASHWTKFTPRASRPKNKVVIQPNQPASETQAQTQPQASQTPQQDNPS